MNAWCAANMWQAHVRAVRRTCIQDSPCAYHKVVENLRDRADELRAGRA